LSSQIPTRARTSTVVLAFASLAAGVLASCDGDQPSPGEAACEVKPTQTFNERIEPLLVEDRPTTCNQCHLSGVDLSAFARETPCKTWACLTDQGLVNPASPDESKILGWILRASPDSDLITDDVIRAEHDAFLEWIEANAACPDACAGVECGDPSEGPACSSGTSDEPPTPPDEPDTRGCSDTELEQAFFDDVYAWRGRCFPCHFDTELEADEEAPRWLSAVGNCQTGSASTLKRVLALGLMNLEEPKQSLLLQKPLDDVGGGVNHGGGAKFTPMDDTYKSFLRFIEHYRECQQP
jgi:hypothetical protein